MEVSDVRKQTRTHIHVCAHTQEGQKKDYEGVIITIKRFTDCAVGRQTSNPRLVT